MRILKRILWGIGLGLASIALVFGCTEKPPFYYPSSLQDESVLKSSTGEESRPDHRDAACIKAEKEAGACYVLFFKEEKTCEDYELYVFGSQKSRRDKKKSKRIKEDLKEYCREAWSNDSCDVDSDSFMDRLETKNTKDYFIDQAVAEIVRYCDIDNGENGSDTPLTDPVFVPSSPASNQGSPSVGSHSVRYSGQDFGVGHCEVLVNSYYRCNFTYFRFTAGCDVFYQYKAGTINKDYVHQQIDSECEHRHRRVMEDCYSGVLPVVGQERIWTAGFGKYGKMLRAVEMECDRRGPTVEEQIQMCDGYYCPSY